LLILVGLVWVDLVIIVLGVMIGIPLPTKFKAVSIASKIKQEGISGTLSARELSESDLSRLLEQIKTFFPRGIKPEHYTDITDILEVIIEESKKPPGIGITIILLFIYLLFIGLILLAAALFLR